MPDISIFGQDFLKNHSHIWNQHPQTCLYAKFHEKTIMLKFGTKNVWFMYFWAGIWKEYCHIWNQHPRMCLIAKPCKNKYPNFGTKNVLFWYFCARILKNYCYIWNQYLRICLIEKFCEETKVIECGTKNALLRYFDKKCLIWVFLFKTF